MTKETAIQKPPIYGFLPDELIAFCKDKGLPGYVAKQCWDWVYDKHVLDVANMRNISKKNQDVLCDVLDFGVFKSVESVRSKEENATKIISVLDDCNMVESVILREKTYNTLCISSQCGCPVDCKFCLTGVVGFKRQLTASEIVMQVVYAFSVGSPIKNVVFMGMGEPLLNYEPVFKAIDILTHEKGYNLSKRHITVSTSGDMKGVARLIKDERYVNLAFSVGSADPVTRLRLMPTEKRNPFVDFVALLKRYQDLHNRKLTLEYTLLAGVNDSEFQVQSLIHLSRYLNAKINLINLNPHPKIPFKPVSTDRLLAIRDHIKRERCLVTIRYKKGQDITAACGQLGESYLK